MTPATQTAAGLAGLSGLSAEVTELDEGGGALGRTPELKVLGERSKCTLRGAPHGTVYLDVWDGQATSYDLTGCAFVQLQEMRYWGRVSWVPGEGYTAEDCTFRNPEHDEDYDPSIKEHIYTLQLVIPGTKPLPEALRPAYPVLTNFKGARRRFAAQICAAHKEAQSPTWAKRNADLVASGLPVRLRVASEVVSHQSRAKKGHMYSVLNAVTTPITVEQIRAITDYQADAKCQRLQDAAAAEYQAWAQSVRESAEGTPAPF